MEAAPTSASPELLTLSARVRMSQMGGPVLPVSLLSVKGVVANISELLPLFVLMQWQPGHPKPLQCIKPYILEIR